VPLAPPLRLLLIVAIVLTAAFALPLLELVRFALKSDLYSHIVLMPFLVGFLIWSDRSRLPTSYHREPATALLPAGLGIILLGGYAVAGAMGVKFSIDDRLATLTAAYVLLLVAATGGLLGRNFLRAVAFPASLLVFMLPMPTVVVAAVETFLQHGSAEVAYWFFVGTGTTIFRQGLIFELPGITLQVAPECSGIHSSLALFITSLVAGYFFLRSRWSRTLLTVAVVPLALLRNGFRILTIGLLCVHVSPDMIHSFIHRQGGPIFFGLSLLPFGLLLVYLRRRETRPGDRAAPAGNDSRGAGT
jgi:exosortase C (VPDSG-CTERM-specific)